MPGNTHSRNQLPPPYSPSALFPPGRQGDGHSVARADPSPEPRSPSDSGYTEQVAAGRRNAVQVHARHDSSISPKMELQRRFNRLRDLTPDSRASYGERIDRIVSYVNKHKELEELPYDALEMCKGLEDDEKRHMVYTSLSESIEVLPFEGGKGLAFAEAILKHHNTLSPDWQNPTKILSNFLSYSSIRIDQLPATLSARNAEKVEWYLRVIEALHQHRGKIFSGSENNVNAGILRNMISNVIDSLVSCMKAGSMVEGAQEPTKQWVSDSVSPRMLPILENFSHLQDRIEHYTTLLENLSDLLVEDRREPFAFKVFLACESLLEKRLTKAQQTSVIEVLLILAKQISTFSSDKKAAWIRPMRELLLLHWNKVGQTSQQEIIETLLPYGKELDAAGRETHLFELKNAADSINDPAFKIFGSLWINNPAELVHGGQEDRQGEGKEVHELSEARLPELS